MTDKVQLTKMGVSLLIIMEKSEKFWPYVVTKWKLIFVYSSASKRDLLFSEGIWLNFKYLFIVTGWLMRVKPRLMDQRVRPDPLERCGVMKPMKTFQWNFRFTRREQLEPTELVRDRVCYGCLFVCDWHLQMCFRLLGGNNGRRTSQCMCLPSWLGQAQPNTS